MASPTQKEERTVEALRVNERALVRHIPGLLSPHMRQNHMYVVGKLIPV